MLAGLAPQLVPIPGRLIQFAALVGRALETLLEPDEQQGPHRLWTHVITSYSIHYTKLYETGALPAVLAAHAAGRILVLPAGNGDEATIGAWLRHDAIAAVHRIADCDGIVFLVMEYVA